MKWYLLKKNKCPKCSKDLTYSTSTVNHDGNMENLITCACGFKISEQKFGEIVASIVGTDIERSYREAQYNFTPPKE